MPEAGDRLPLHPKPEGSGFRVSVLTKLTAWAYTVIMGGTPMMPNTVCCKGLGSCK